jgi:hypothetical protein
MADEDLLQELMRLERQLAEREQARRLEEARLVLLEADVLRLVANPGPAVRRGELVKGADGAPVPDSAVRRRAERLHAQIRRDLARLRGESPPETASDVGE